MSDEDFWRLAFGDCFDWFDDFVDSSPRPFAQITVICRFDESLDTALILGDEDRDWLIKTLQHWHRP